MKDSTEDIPVSDGDTGVVAKCTSSATITSMTAITIANSVQELSHSIFSGATFHGPVNINVNLCDHK